MTLEELEVMRQALDALEKMTPFCEPGFDNEKNTIKAMKKILATFSQKNCEYCDGSGHVHDLTGEWRGICHCGADPALLFTTPSAQPAPTVQEPVALGGQRHLVEILAENWRVWPARKAVEQTSLGDVYCSAKGRDLLFGNHEIAADQDSVVVTKEMWSTMRQSLATQPAPTRKQATWLEILRNNKTATDEVIGAFLRGHAEYLTGETFVLTSPPVAQRQWVGLTDEEYLEAEKCVWAVVSLDDTEKEANCEFARAIEAKLKEKNT